MLFLLSLWKIKLIQMANSWRKILSQTDIGKGGTHDKYLNIPKKIKINGQKVSAFSGTDQDPEQFYNRKSGRPGKENWVFIDHIDKVTFDNCGDYTYGTGVDDEPCSNDSVESFANSYFVYSGVTTNCEFNMDINTGEVTYNGETYNNLADFYGCFDEDQESVQGIRIRD